MRKLVIGVMLLMTLGVGAQESDEYLMDDRPDSVERVEENLVTVPDVLFMEEYQATDFLRGAGFSNLRRVSIPTETRSGVVLYLVPPVGHSAKPEERITVFVSQQRKKKETERKSKVDRQGVPAITKSAVFGLPYWLLLQLFFLWGWVRLAARVDRDREVGQILFIGLSQQPDKPAESEVQPPPRGETRPGS